jgi:hypothetical protein
MKRKTIVIAAGGALAAGLAAGAVVAALGANAADRSPQDAGTGVHSTQKPHDVATYWTDERKRNATGG